MKITTIIALLFVISYGDSSDVRSEIYPKVVSWQGYGNVNDCWTRESKQVAYIVFAEYEDEHFPFLISPICDLDVDIAPPGQGFLDALSAIQLVPGQRVLSDVLPPGEATADATVSHPPPVQDSSPVYIFVGKIGNYGEDRLQMYEVKSSEILQSAGIRFS